ncbi:MAG: hypothetical protein IJQ28_06300 [Clostridia bacterium]|nr:hypothetical protein [Clostridia bacterium]
MIKMLFPVVIIVFSNVFYNLATKFTPSQANSFLSLTITYITAAVLSFVSFIITSDTKNLAVEFSKLNWTAYVLGITIIGLELGYILLYRAGWKIGVGSLVANITLACVLLLIGVFCFKENFSIKQLLGMVICVIGLVMITK